MERAVATIDRAALVHNLARVRDLAPAGEIFAASATARRPAEIR